MCPTTPSMPRNHPPRVEGHGDGKRELYPLLTPTPFCLPNDPGDTAVYVRPIVAGQPVDPMPLTRTEQASIDTQFVHAKDYYLLMCNIKRGCFTALNASINDAFKMSNDPTIQSWHAGICVIDILDQLSTIGCVSFLARPFSLKLSQISILQYT